MRSYNKTSYWILKRAPVSCYNTGCPSKTRLNSLAPGRSECDSKNVIFNLVLLIGIFRSSHDNALRWMSNALWWMSQDLTDDKSRLVQVMATSHYLNQCWPRSMSPYGVIRPQWVKLKSREILFDQNICFSCETILEICIEHVSVTDSHTLHKISKWFVN